jgi:FAD/FMN-containing dehydrogenase
MKKLVLTNKRRTTLIALVLATSGAFAGYKVVEYSADPVGEKDCPPLAGDAAVVSADELAKLPPPAAAPALPWARQGGTINDASCLNRTAIYGIVQVRNVDDLKNALQFAKDNRLKVSIAGVRHSMGGQAFFKNALVLDMTRFNAMSLDEGAKVLTVQSGATWHDIQSYLHPKYAVKAMQSTDIFSVGGSISVNAHGMDHQVGALGKTIRSMRVMLPDGSIQRVSRTENPELFNLVVGGYGLFGIVLDVELDITDNVIYETSRQIIDYKAFPDLFATELAANQKLGLRAG